MIQIAGVSLCLSLFATAPMYGQTRAPDSTSCPVIPRPAHVEQRKGEFTIDRRTSIVLDPATPRMKELATLFTESLRRGSGLALKLAPAAKLPRGACPLVFRLTVQDSASGSESYRLSVSPARVEVLASSEAGIFYAMQTILQLAPVRDSLIPPKSITIPALEIEDAPRFGWRGTHLDVCRHFFPKEFIKKYIDILAAHKINVFHWHLTDDQGWRVEIKKYPRLTEVGAWRVDREERDWRARQAQRPGERATYGGFYTQDDVREIVEYARQRCITVLPEIEMPAHSMAALAAYPEYSCSGGPFTVPPGSIWPDTVIFCAGNDGTFAFIENILSEIIGLFPGKYIHIGGDEADKTGWKHCPRCQARMKAEGLRDELELQSYFVKRIEKFLASKGRRLIGWDEILEGGLAPEAAVMSWRGTEGGIAAAREGHDVVMSPDTHCYFDYYQGQADDEPLAIGGFLPVSRVYTFEPVPDSLTAEQGKHVLGGQANLWTEYIATTSHAEYMLLPRLSALAEVVWSPKELRNWEDFSRRLESHFMRFDAMNWNSAKCVYNVAVSTSPDTTAKKVLVALSTELSRLQIRFTLDGSEVRGSSPLYSAPIPLVQTTTLRAAAFDGVRMRGRPAVQVFTTHKAAFRPVRYTNPVSPYYPGGGTFGMTDMVRGGLDHHSGRWQGFSRVDCEVIIDLGQVEQISRITTGCLQNMPAHIFFPDSVQYSLSDDGVNFTPVGSVLNTVPQNQDGVLRKDFSAGFEATPARYVKVCAKNVSVCPPWHQAAGTEAWVFVDEILVE